ncbi:MAG: hypothetical protein AB7L13_16975 [Acidimicrobiia bacterium]
MSEHEVRATSGFHAVWGSVADAVPNDYPKLADVQAMPEWDQWRRAALSALEVFAVRGFLSEDEEVY